MTDKKTEQVQDQTAEAEILSDAQLDDVQGGLTLQEKIKQATTTNLHDYVEIEVVPNVS